MRLVINKYKMMINKKHNYIHPWTITGLIDAEGSFNIAIVKDDSRTNGFVVSVSFIVGLNIKDKYLLLRIKNTLGVGNIYYNSADNTYRLKVSNLSDIYNTIIPHFNKYPLVSQKRADFETFAKTIDILINKGHLNKDGLQDIANLKASLNLGLSDSLKYYFPNTKYIPRPFVNFDGIPDPHWLSGFAEGEACFYVSIYKSLKSKAGFAVQLVFKITQHSRDIALLKGISEYFSCGRVENRKTRASDFTVTSFKGIEENIIPFFVKYPLQGSKLLNFQDFKKVVEIMKAKEHLTEEGLDKIIKIKAKMNKGRDKENI